MVDVRRSAAAPVGAYGLRVSGAAARHLLVEADPLWPEVVLSTRVTDVDDEPEEVTDHSARLRLKTGGRIVLDRAAATARFDVPRELGPEELVHPFLAPVAAVMSYWLGRETFHAGAVAFGSAAWAIVGDRGSGKSTLLAALAAAGHDVVADDLVVFEPATLRLFAGPRSIDLREEAASRLGSAREIGVAGARERWRVQLGPVPQSLTLRGWVFLDWADDEVLVELGAARRIELLARHRGVTLPPRDPGFLLGAASLPCLELSRPRAWESLPRVAAALAARLAG